MKVTPVGKAKQRGTGEKATSAPATIPLQATPHSERLKRPVLPPMEWKPLWDYFLQTHKDWWKRIDAKQPVYALPTHVIDTLAGSTPTKGKRRRSEALITDQDAEAERHFTSMCRFFHEDVVGVWLGKPVHYPLLCEHTNTFVIQDTVSNQWVRNEIVTEDALHAFSNRGNKRLDAAAHTMLGYVGLLTRSEPYRKTVEQVHATWRQLPHPPLGDSLNGQTLGPLAALMLPSSKRTNARRRLAEYERQLKQLCQALFIQEFRTWDLPIPWPPFGVQNLSDMWWSLGNNTQVFFHPPYFKVPTELEIRSTIRRWQEHIGASGKTQGVLPISEIAPHHGRSSAYETMFRLWIVEVAARQRYGSPRGMAARLLQALGPMLRITVPRLKRIRQRFARHFNSE